MLNGNIRSQIDKLWLEFHSGGITNPLTVIEQISYLMFARMLDITETRNEKKHSRMEQKKKPSERQEYSGIFTGHDKIRWSHFQKLDGKQMLGIVRDQLFPFFHEELADKNKQAAFLKDAQFLIPKASILVTAVNVISKLPLTEGDTKGDLYEYLLSKLTTAGINGQFRTPRHIIRTMVEMLKPHPTDTVCDPACGTGGFLVEVINYLRRSHSTPEMIQDATDENGKVIIDEDGNPVKFYPGDQLDPYLDHIKNEMLHGFDFDITMLRIAAMNLMLHSIEFPNINYQDTLGTSFSKNFPTRATDGFEVILANPPFKGSLDESDVDSSLKSVVKTKKTELLFLVLMLRMLKMGGRCAVIVPDGVLFGSSKAHQSVRKTLIENNQLEAVVSLPSGVFKPYAGVTTAVLIFTKGGKTDNVWFYKVEADGYSLDDKRTKVKKNDLPDLLKRWNNRDAEKDIDRKQKAFYVPAEDIIANKYDLSINRYKEVAYEEVEYEEPKVILGKLRKLEEEIFRDLDELEGMLG